MLMLLCVQIVQTNNNKERTSYSRQAKDMWPCQESKK
jgi:hypothetical protein